MCYRLKFCCIFALFMLATVKSQSNEDGNRRIEISEDLLPVEHVANSLTVINWHEPVASPIYCTGDLIFENLKFSCPECNNATLDYLLEQHTVDLRKSLGKFPYPAIKLYEMPVDGSQWNGRKLRCVGLYGNGNNDAAVFREALVNVTYLKKPVIAGYGNHYPLSTVASTFYYDPAKGFYLTCNADGNPSPKQYKWLSAGKQMALNTSPQLQINTNYLQLSCIAGVETSYPHPQESYTVSVLALSGSSKPDTNFDEISRSVDSDTNAVPLGSTFSLQCNVKSSPKATIRWLHANTAGVISDASCYEGTKVQDRQETVGQNDYWYTTSTCSLHLNSFDNFGHYWCLGCIELAQNYSECSNNPDKLHKENVFFNVTGSPYLSKVNKPRVEHSDNTVTVFVPFCSNPVPNRNNIYWLIDNEKVFIDNRFNNIFANDYIKNTNHPLCYELPLSITDPQNSDKSLSYRLYIENSQGHVIDDVPIGKYLIGNDTDESSTSLYSSPAAFDSVAIGVAVAVVIFVIVGLCLCAYLWFTSKACFSFRKTKEKTEKYPSSVASSQLTTTEMTPEKQPNGNDTDAQQSSEKSCLNGHNKSENNSTYVKSCDADFDVTSDGHSSATGNGLNERQRMLPKISKKPKIDSAV